MLTNRRGGGEIGIPLESQIEGQIDAKSGQNTTRRLAAEDLKKASGKCEAGRIESQIESQLESPIDIKSVDKSTRRRRN